MKTILWIAASLLGLVLVLKFFSGRAQAGEKDGDVVKKPAGKTSVSVGNKIMGDSNHRTKSAADTLIEKSKPGGITRSTAVALPSSGTVKPVVRRSPRQRLLDGGL